MNANASGTAPGRVQEQTLAYGGPVPQTEETIDG